MTPADVLTILLAAKAVDDRVTPDQAKAAAWHAILNPAMTLEVAREALIAHYASSTEAIMPAHLNRAWQEHLRHEGLKAERERRELMSGEGVPMPDEVRAKLRDLMSRWSA